ncbi:unnamed protein product, partial [marine sediment metagenome]
SDGTELLRVGEFGYIKSISINPTDGTCWVTNIHLRQIIKFAPDGTELLRIGGFHDSLSVSVNPADGTCWVADLYRWVVVKLASDGTELVRVTGLCRPSAISVNPGYYGSYDKIPPQITIESPVGGEVFVAALSTITISYQVTDNIDPSPVVFAYLTDLEQGTTVQVYNAQEIDPIDIGGGFWTLTVDAQDSANNMASSTTARFEVIVDTTPPVTELEIGEPQFEAFGRIVISPCTPITLTAIDPGSGDAGSGISRTEYRVYKGTIPCEYTVYSGSFTISTGIQALEYRSIDNVGNIEDEKSITLTVTHISNYTAF